MSEKTANLTPVRTSRAQPDRRRSLNTPADSDEELYARFVDRDDMGAFEELVGRWQGVAYRTARFICGNTALAEEAVQIAFVRMAQSAHRFEDRGPGSFRPWLVRLVANSSHVVRRTERRASRKKTVDRKEYARRKGLDAAPDSPAEKSELFDALEKTLHVIEERWRTPVVLHYIGGLKHREVATVLGVSQQTISRRIEHGLELLRIRLAQAGFSCSLAVLGQTLAEEDLVTLPSGFQQKLIEASKAEAAQSARTALATLPSSAAKVAAMCGGLAVATVATVAWWVATPPSSSGKKPTVQENAAGKEAKGTPFAFQWNFEGPQDVPGFSIVEGSWRHLPNGGKDGTGCMETERGLISIVLEVDVPSEALPLLLAFDGKARPYSPPRDEVKYGYTALGFWKHYPDCALFRNIGPQYDGAPWSTHEIYVTRSYIAAFFRGRLVTFTIGSRYEDSPLHFCFRGPHRVDNLVVKTIGSDQLPDVSLYMNALERIGPERRKGIVEIPWIESQRPPNPVHVEFMPPQLPAKQ